MLQVTDRIERLRGSLRERRRHARRKFVCEARLPVGVSMPDEEIDPEAESYPEPILGHTLDLSESGLSLALPAVSLGGTDVTRPGARLRLVLSLPTGLIVVQAETVRAAPLQAGPGDPARHVVGARITKLFETDRRNYRDFLRRFATGRTG